MKLQLLSIFALSSFISGPCFATETIGTLLVGSHQELILDTDLPELSAAGLGTLALGTSVDALALRLGKFGQVPRYRLTRILQGLIANNRESMAENVDTVLLNVVANLKKSCEPDKPCTFKIFMKSADWTKPVPNYSAPAKQRDIDFYNNSFMQSYYENDIEDQVSQLRKFNQVNIFGQAFSRGASEGPMSQTEENEFRTTLQTIYRENYIANHFVKTKHGIYWAEPVRQEFRNFPWNDFAVRSPSFPETYPQLIEIIKQGLNRFYLSQKREEIFNQALAFKGSLKKAVSFLLDQTVFLPSLSNSSGKPAIAFAENYKQAVLDVVDKLISEKSEMTATYIVRQSIMTIMEKKDHL